MQFGKVSNPASIDFTLPPDHQETKRVLSHFQVTEKPEIYIGCPRWNRAHLEGFYPKGTKDELAYYSTQLNCIELNSTFYNIPSAYQVATWRDKTPDNFKFFPKLPKLISHDNRLMNVRELTRQFCDIISIFEEKLGSIFLQLHENFSPKEFYALQTMVEEFPETIPLAVEIRNGQWFSDHHIFEKYTSLFERLNISNVITDTAGRRDLLHMRLTSSEAFIRFVGSRHTESDISRLNEWAARIQQWHKEGLQKLYFFVHQNADTESPELAVHFIKEINRVFQLNLHVPVMTKQDDIQMSLF